MPSRQVGVSKTARHSPHKNVENVFLHGHSQGAEHASADLGSAIQLFHIQLWSAGFCSHLFFVLSGFCMRSWNNGSHLNGWSQVCKGTLSSQQSSQLMQGTGQGAPHSRLSVQKQLAVRRPQLWPLLLTGTCQHSREIERSGEAQL